MSRMVRSQRHASSLKSKSQGRASKRPRPTVDLAWNDDDDRDGGAREMNADSDIDSNESDYEGGNNRATPSDEEEEDDDRRETLDEKKIRMAREYLARIDSKPNDEDSSSGSSSNDLSASEDDEENSHDRISRKLQQERQKKEGTYERILADRVSRHLRSLISKAMSFPTAREIASSSLIHPLRGHDLTPTCLALLGEEKVVSGAKDHSVFLWDLETQTRISTVAPHWKDTAPASNDRRHRTAGEVLSIACSSDGRYTAVGIRDSTVRIFDLRAKPLNQLVKTFTGHKGPVTCVAFRSQSHTLFSGSADRCIRHYNLDEMLYLETLYGHQFAVNSIDCHLKERPISVGQDRTARAWKLAEDSHLIFRGGGRLQAADCVSIIKDDWFVTGHQDGHVSLWMTEKKKAVASIEQAHGVDEESSVSRCISSVSSLKMTDVMATGSYDGFLRLWKVRTGRTLEDRGMQALGEIYIPGYINSIAMGPKAKFCVAAVGQEHRSGRWNRISRVKNRILIVKLHDTDLNDVDVPLTDENGVEKVDAPASKGHVMNDDVMNGNGALSSSESSDPDSD